MAIEITPDQYLGLSQGEPAPTIEEVENRLVDNAARGLAQRAASVNKATAGDTDMLAAETKLLDLQKEITRETDPIKLEILQAKAEALASGLVGGPVEPTSSATKQPQKGPQEQSIEDLTQDIRNSYGDADAILENAGSVLGAEKAAEYNELLESGDEGQTRAAMETLRHLRESPQNFTAATPGHVINDEAYRYAVETFSEPVAEQIRTLSAAVNEGHVSSAEAIATASRDPKLLAALLTGANAGMWTISL